MYNQYEESIRQIMQEKGSRVLSIDHVGGIKSPTFYVHCELDEFVIKFRKNANNKNIIKRLVRNQFNKRFLNKEICMYHFLSKTKSEKFKIPDFISSEKNKSLLLRFFDSNDLTHNESLGQEIVEALIEFNNLGDKVNELKIIDRLFNFINRPVIKLVYLTLFKVAKMNGLSCSLKGLVIILKSSINQKNQESFFLLHRDIGLSRHNVFKSNDLLYLIDFESVVLEKKWIMQDIIDASINDNFELDKNMINSYIDKLKDKLDITKTQLDLQIRICLMYRLLTVMDNKKILKGQAYNSRIDFFNNVLMNDENYKNWYGC